MKKYEDEFEIEDGKEIENFTVHYSDGTKKIIEKGFFCEVKRENGNETLDFIMAHCAGDDLKTIVFGCLELGVKMGYLG